MSDLQSSTNAAVFACDLNARTNSNISVRLDHLAEKLNQLDQRTSSNRDNIGSLRSSLDQFRSVSETQFLSLRHQLQALSESSNTERLLSPPLSSVEVVDTKHTVVKIRSNTFVKFRPNAFVKFRPNAFVKSGTMPLLFLCPNLTE